METFRPVLVEICKLSFPVHKSHLRAAHLELGNQHDHSITRSASSLWRLGWSKANADRLSEILRYLKDRLRKPGVSQSRAVRERREARKIAAMALATPLDAPATSQSLAPSLHPNASPPRQVRDASGDSLAL